jgi:hypothetical protein
MAMKKTLDEKIAEAQEKEEKWREKKIKLQTKKTKTERKADTRRKILLGGFLIALLGKKDKRAEEILQECYVSLKESDQNLFENFELRREN